MRCLLLAQNTAKARDIAAMLGLDPAQWDTAGFYTVIAYGTTYDKIVVLGPSLRNMVRAEQEYVRNVVFLSLASAGSVVYS